MLIASTTAQYSAGWNRCARTCAVAAVTRNNASAVAVVRYPSPKVIPSRPPQAHLASDTQRLMLEFMA